MLPIAATILGTYLPLGLGADTLKTTVFTVNGQPDLVTNNNLFIRKSKTGLPAGTYTIGINDSDFSSFEEVEEIINDRGICGKIDFIVRAGEYKGLVKTIRDVERMLLLLKRLVDPSLKKAVDSIIGVIRQR